MYPLYPPRPLWEKGQGERIGKKGKNSLIVRLCNHPTAKFCELWLWGVHDNVARTPHALVLCPLWLPSYSSTLLIYKEVHDRFIPA